MSQNSDMTKKCLQCGKQIKVSLVILDNDSGFCEECEMGDYEGKMQ